MTHPLLYVRVDGYNVPTSKHVATEYVVASPDDIRRAAAAVGLGGTLVLDADTFTLSDRRSKGCDTVRDWCCEYHDGFFDGASNMASAAEALVNGPEAAA